MKLFSRIAAAVLLLTGGLLIAPSPARADSSTCGALLGSYVSNNYIGLCVIDDWDSARPDPGVALYSGVSIGSNATKATNCKVTMWAAMDKAGASPWYTPQVSVNCKQSLDTRNTQFDYFHYYSGTSATEIDTKACVDLYWNGSTTSGWHGCLESGWHPIR